MYKLTLWYSVQNGGDGSAYPSFFETKELAEWDQDNQDEGFGECCIGDIVIESESPITCKEDVTTVEEYLAELQDHVDDYDVGSQYYAKPKKKLDDFIDFMKNMV